MVIVLFRSRLADAAGADYADTADAMLARARTFPGFVAFRHYDAADGERLSVIWWQSEETLRAWADDPEHRAAQRRGRERWYAWWRIEVAEVVRSYGG